MTDLTGAVFTDLIVIKYFGRRFDNRDYWVCKCSCGKRNHLVSGKNLKSGVVKRCDNLIHREGRARSGEQHPFWKGDKVSYKCLHAWIRKYLPKPGYCTDCKQVPPYDVANISQKYIRDLSDWEWLCRKCHMKKDGRMKNLWFNHGSGNLNKVYVAPSAPPATGRGSDAN